MLDEQAAGFEPVTSARDMWFGHDVVPHPHETLITNTRKSALDFHAAQTTRLSRRSGTRDQKSFSIPKSGEIGTFAWIDRCLDTYYKTLTRIKYQKFRDDQLPYCGKFKPQP